MPRRSKPERGPRRSLYKNNSLHQAQFGPKSRSILKRTPLTTPQTRQQTLTQIDFIIRREPSEDELEYEEPDSPRPRKRRKCSNVRRVEGAISEAISEKDAPVPRDTVRSLRQEESPMPEIQTNPTLPAAPNTSILSYQPSTAPSATPKKSRDRIISSSQSPTESVISTKSRKSPWRNLRSPLKEVSANGRRLRSGALLDAYEVERGDKEDLQLKKVKGKEGKRLVSVPFVDSEVRDDENGDSSINYGTDVRDHGNESPSIKRTKMNPTGTSTHQTIEIQDSEEELEESQDIHLYEDEIYKEDRSDGEEAECDATTIRRTETDEAAAQLNADLLRSTQAIDQRQKPTSHSAVQRSPRLSLTAGLSLHEFPRPSQATTVDTTQTSQRELPLSRANVSTDPSILETSPNPLSDNGKSSNSDWDRRTLTDSQMLPESIMNFQIPQIPSGTQESLLEEV